MVKAYTLSDKIVQQGFNDFESMVGMVIKRPDGGGDEISSIEALTASGATPITIGQIASYYVDDSGEYNTYQATQSPVGNSVIDRLFGGSWNLERSPEICDQWVVIRRFESTPIVDPASITSNPIAIVYRVVADCYLSVVEP